MCMLRIDCVPNEAARLVKSTSEKNSAYDNCGEVDEEQSVQDIFEACFRFRFWVEDTGGHLADPLGIQEQMEKDGTADSESGNLMQGQSTQDLHIEKQSEYNAHYDVKSKFQHVFLHVHPQSIVLLLLHAASRMYLKTILKKTQ